MVPFLITNENLEYPILGYNVIEELVQPVNPLDNQSTHISAVQASFEDLDETVLLHLIKLIQDTKADRLCTIIGVQKGTLSFQQNEQFNLIVEQIPDR